MPGGPDLNFVLIGGPATEWLGNITRLADAVLGPRSPLRTSASSNSGSSGNDPNAGVELALGIRRDGSPEILLTANQANSIVNQLRCPKPTKRRSLFDYESVSPITFRTQAELEKKLKDMYKKPKSKAKRPVLNENEGVGRGAFEHGRVLYNILKDTLNPTKYGLPEATWKQSFRLSSLAFNKRSGDTRPSYDKFMYPLLVDIGWSEATIPDITPKNNSTKHFRVYEQQYASAGGTPMMFVHGPTGSPGDTVTLESSKISETLKEVFGGLTDSTREPLVLLVHDEKLTRNALKNFGIDTSTWVSGLKDLLGYPTREFKRGSTLSTGVRQEDYDYGRSRSSSSHTFDRGRSSTQTSVKKEEHDYHDSNRVRRSRSPSSRRSIKPDPDRSPTLSLRDYSSTPSSQRWRDNDHGRVYAPVYVVDTKPLYITLLRKEDGSGSTVSIAQRFNMRGEDDHGWCAGNEAVLLFQIWHSMISGPPVDEQNRARAAGWMDGPGEQIPPMAPEDDDDDEDWDPNNVPSNPTAVLPVEKKQGGLYESDSEDGYSDDD